MAVANRLIHMVTEVTHVKEHIVRLNNSHILGVISLVCLHAPTGASEGSVLGPAPDGVGLVSQGE